MGTVSLHRQPSFLLLPQYHHAAPPSTYIHGTDRDGWGLEAPYDDLLFIGKAVVQASRSNSGLIWNDRASVHAERYQLHDLLHFDVHSSAFGKFNSSWY